MVETFQSRGAELLFARKSVALFQAIELAEDVKLNVRRKLPTAALTESCVHYSSTPHFDADRNRG